MHPSLHKLHLVLGTPPVALRKLRSLCPAIPSVDIDVTCSEELIPLVSSAERCFKLTSLVLVLGVARSCICLSALEVALRKLRSLCPAMSPHAESAQEVKFQKPAHAWVLTYVLKVQVGSLSAQLFILPNFFCPTFALGALSKVGQLCRCNLPQPRHALPLRRPSWHTHWTHLQAFNAPV